ncbi:hybrid sensor histidine kinase/response regulator, partial [bacterium]|nr:hybrid sensor histidine kinase/response regulator [bacterium]
MKSTSLNLLLIESNRGDRRWVREALHWGEVKGICPPYYLHQCERVEQALERLKEGNADVILVDLDLPGSSGTNALNSLKLAVPDTPILALTGRDDDEFGLEAIRNGAQDFLVKGHTDKRHLVRSVLFAVERNRMLDQIQRSEKGWNSILAKLRDMGTGRGVSRLTREFVHEFNNLMSVLKGYSLLLRRNLKDSGQEYEWACKLVDTLDRGTGLTRSLQDFSASGTSTSEPTDLNELLVRVYESLRTFTGQKHSSELNFSELPEITVASQELEGTLLALLLFAPDLRQQGKIIKWFTSKVHLSAEE